MAPRYRRVAVIGAGPSGIAATHALAAEKAFDTIRVFERRDRVGGLWHYDPEPDVFPETPGVPPKRDVPIPTKLPAFASPAGQDPRARSALYWDLDTNVGASVMAFSHTPFPEGNSPTSIKRLGHNNPSRPYQAITNYIEDLFQPFLPLVSLSTTVEKVEKIGSEWILTLRKSKTPHRDRELDYWWSERFDAVIVASGHYHVPFVPNIPGLSTAAKALPGRFQHSKSYRKAQKFVDKRVLVVGGSISAADFINDLYAIVKGNLELSIRTHNPALESVYNLPNVRQHSTLQSVSIKGPKGSEKIVVQFDDGSSVDDLDYVLFATGYHLQYPFLHPNPTTPENRVSGFYEHIFHIGDPSLALVGQVKAALSFRVYEYQAVAVARYFASRSHGTLPSISEQRQWEKDRVREKGSSDNFHAIAPEFRSYFDFLADFAGEPAADTDGYALPKWDDSWEEKGLAILGLKGKYWQSIIDRQKTVSKL